MPAASRLMQKQHLWKKGVVLMRHLSPKRHICLVQMYACRLLLPKAHLRPSSVCSELLMNRVAINFVSLAVGRASPPPPQIPPLLLPRPASRRTLKIQRSCLLISRGD